MIEDGFLKETLNQILCCPVCKGSLIIDVSGDLRCQHCRRNYPVEDGIIVLLAPEMLRQQSGEQKLREEAARHHGNSDSDKILKTVSCHHCVPVMTKKARNFRLSFSSADWLLDVGCGSGYYWLSSKAGGRLILMDFAYSNLKAARHLLKEQKEIIFVQADAACLPFKPYSVSGVWSVQVTQHFTDSVFGYFLNELERVLKNEYLIEVYNLNPALFHRILHRILGKKMHIGGKWNGMRLNLYNQKELLQKWQDLSLKGKEFNFGYSELFFHPYLRLRPQNEHIGRLEEFLKRIPGVASLFARQIQIKISSNKNE